MSTDGHLGAVEKTNDEEWIRRNFVDPEPWCKKREITPLEELELLRRKQAGTMMELATERLWRRRSSGWARTIQADSDPDALSPVVSTDLSGESLKNYEKAKRGEDGWKLEVCVPHESERLRGDAKMAEMREDMRRMGEKGAALAEGLQTVVYHQEPQCDKCARGEHEALVDFKDGVFTSALLSDPQQRICKNCRSLYLPR